MNFDDEDLDLDIGDNEVVSKSINIRSIDPHPKQKALIIKGEIALAVRNRFSPIILAEETSEFKKLVSLEDLQKEDDTEEVVDAIFGECRFLDPELRGHVVVTVDFLKNREYDEHDLAVSPGSSISEKETSKSKGNVISSTPTTPTEFPDLEADLVPFQTQGYLEDEEGEGNEAVDISELDTYVELLYEDAFGEKIRGARCIAKLAKSPENLAGIAYHQTALNALLRTLREEYRKSLDLTTNIISVCLSYSKYKDFHPILLSNKICTITLDIVEFELQRHEKWRQEVGRREDMIENRDQFPGSAGSFQKAKTEFEKMRVKFGELTMKQDYLLALAFDLILYMTEIKGLRSEVVGRGIVPMLMDGLCRKSIDLLKNVLRFLKTLAIYAPCKTQMAQMYVVENVAHLMDSNVPSEVIRLSLELLFNLSFDTKLRHKIVISGLIPKFALYMEDSALEQMTMKLLYVLSMDRKVRPRFGSILQIIPTLSLYLNEGHGRGGGGGGGDTIRRRKNSPPSDAKSRRELAAAILVNLAIQKKCAVFMCQEKAGGDNGELIKFLQQAFANEDDIVMKIVRNLSNHDVTREKFAPFIPDLARAILDAGSEDFILECIGTLGNLEMPMIDFCKLLQEFNLVPWMQNVFNEYLTDPPVVIPQKQDENKKADFKTRLILGVAVLAGTCCSDAECAELFIQEGILDQLLKILIMTSDPQLKSQVLYCLYKMCCHPVPKQHIIDSTQLPKIVLELLQEDNIDIQQLCEGIMNLFGKSDEEWMKKLKEKRFRFYNEAWIEMIQRSGDEEDDNAAYGYSYGNSRDKGASSDVLSSASETFITEDESDDDGQSDLEMDKDEGDEGSGDRRSGNGRERKSSIFDKFKDQFEYEMKMKKFQSQLEVSDDDIDEEMGKDKAGRRPGTSSAAAKQ